MCLTTSARRRAVFLQHLLDEIDSPARTIEFVAQQDIGRAGRGTEAAMHALAQDGVGFGDIGIGQLSEAEFGLHAGDPDEAPGRVIRPRLRMPFGSKLCRTRSLKAATPALAGWNTSTCRLTSSVARSSMACPPTERGALAHQRRLRIRPRRHRRPDQAAAPVVEHVAPGFAGETLAQRRARGWRADDTPHRPGAERALGRKRLRHRERIPTPPPNARLRSFQRFQTAIAAWQARPRDVRPMR